MGWLRKLLLEYSTKHYYVEYRKFLSNHIAHGILALERLGATEARTRQWADWYVKEKCELPSSHDHTEEHVDDSPLPATEVDNVNGKRMRYYALLNYYFQRLDECHGDIDSVLKAEFPPLSLGMQASLLHAMIQIGYGYASGVEQITLEGIAYLRHSNFPIFYDENNGENDISKFGQGDTEITEVLKELKRDDELFEFMGPRAKELEEADYWVAKGIQSKVKALTEKGDQLISYANKVKVPKEVLVQEKDKGFEKLADWILHQILTVYTMAQDERQNDFVLLHGVTCAWSVKQIIHTLEPKDALEALRTLVCLIFAAYITVGGPHLSTPVDNNLKVSETDWKELINIAIADDSERDEHVYKLVQVCYELWQNPENAKNAPLYFTASTTVVNKEFCPFNPSKPRL